MELEGPHGRDPHPHPQMGGSRSSGRKPGKSRAQLGVAPRPLTPFSQRPWSARPLHLYPRPAVLGHRSLKAPPRPPRGQPSCAQRLRQPHPECSFQNTQQLLFLLSESQVTPRERFVHLVGTDCIPGAVLGAWEATGVELTEAGREQAPSRESPTERSAANKRELWLENIP